jgi:tetratricopeptide (TPR) repeat protein
MDFDEARALHQKGDLAAAERGYRAVLACGPNALALCNLALIRKTNGDLIAAESLLREAISVAPEELVANYNLGNLYWRGGRLDDAEHLLVKAVRLGGGPPAMVNLGHVYLALGRDAEGWPLYDQRTDRLNAQTQRLSFPEWSGQPLEGKRLFVWSEQGFGDQILAARFIAHLGAAEVTLVCPQELVRLFKQLPATVVARDGMVAAAGHDYWILPMSLPRWAARQPPTPYLTAPARGRGGIGVVWSGNALPDPNRSLPPELGARLLALPSARSLHPEHTGARDFQDTAEIISGLDLVISIDTSVAHLAGALGKRTLVLLQHQSTDWRWRDRFPWYSSVSVIRQPKPGDWAGALDLAEQSLGLR